MSGLIIGLTGGIGSGKSTVARLFAELGVGVVDADDIARALVRPGQPALAAIIAHFGRALLTPQGELDRRRLRERIFADAQAKSWLNALLHPLIRERMLADCAAASSPYCLLVVPLLFENGLESLVARTLVVDVSEATQIARTCARDGVDEAQVRAILASQLPRAERRRRGDDLLDNEPAAPEALRARVQALHGRYLELASQHERSMPLH